MKQKMYKRKKKYIKERNTDEEEGREKEREEGRQERREEEE